MDLIEKVDAYWEWRDSRNPSVLSTLGEVQRLTDAELGQWEDQWDLKAFYFHIDVVLPTCLLEKIDHLPDRPEKGDYGRWHTGDELPVPASLFRTMSDCEVSLFSSWAFPKDVYVVMVDIVRSLNTQFWHGLPDKFLSLLDQIELKPGLLLMGVGAVLNAEEFKEQQQSDERQESRRQTLSRFEREKKEIQQAIEVLRSCMATYSCREQSDSVYEDVGRWISKRVPEPVSLQFLDEMQEKAEARAEELTATYQSVTKLFTAELPNRKNELTSESKKVLVGMWEAVISTGRSKRKSTSVLMDLLDTVGYRLNDESVDRNSRIQALNTNLRRWAG